MAKVLVVADDLTGAADCGVAFAGRGAEAMVLLSGPGGDIPDVNGRESAEVLAIDADTRCLPREQAGEVVGRIVQSLGRLDGRSGLLFKKVDSTLRGNVGAELAAALHARRASSPSPGPVAMLFAPAFPAQGRTTVGGVQMVNGWPLEQAGLRHGEEPVPRGAMDAVLRETGLACASVGLATIRAGAGRLEEKMQRMARDVDALICDAETEDDLRAIARAGMSLAPNVVWAGSGGLARHLAKAIGIDGAAGSTASPAGEVRAHGPTLFVVGSPSSVSREQARALAVAPGVACFTFAAETIVSPGPSPESHPMAAMMMEHLENGEDVLLQVESADRCSAEQGRRVAQSLGRAIRPCAKRLSALVATGGETARAILDAWGIRHMRLIGEVEPGVPYSVAECGSRSIRILTKAGGFGTRETLLHCREFLRSPEWTADKHDAATPIEGRKS